MIVHRKPPEFDLGMTAKRDEASERQTLESREIRYGDRYPAIGRENDLKQISAICSVSFIRTRPIHYEEVPELPVGPAQKNLRLLYLQ
jgi:hypothetical protein